MLRQYELVDIVKSYDPNADEGMLNRAYIFGTKVHGSQTRHSGDPYFSHPIEVAGILTKLKLDVPTIVTALLHDTIEDTEVSYEQLEELFGKEVADLVNGVTKLSHIQFTDKQVKQAENFRKFFLATSKDVRVLLVKLADRLHNMRTINHIPKEEKRRAIAKETLEIYAPLAGRIGMQGFKEELEDRAFAVAYPEARESVVNRLTYLGQESGDVTTRITERIQESLEAKGIEAVVYGRHKRPYSVWRKMERKHVSFEQLADIIGFRVIVSTPEECYAALGVIHSRWKMVPGFFKDYISTPKRNGYQSIHTTIFGPDDQRVELQIRTHAMHEIAETGVAAHWDYKEQAYTLGDNKGKARKGDVPDQFSSSLRQTLFRDLRGLADLFDGEESSQVFLEHTKLEMYADQVFAFTPKGDLIGLPQGATAIDFAYAVHTRIGDTCVGAKINGRHRPLRTVLHNGDSVQIVCSKAQGPTADWENIVVTGRARSAIRRYIRQNKRDDFIDLGEKILKSAFRKRDLPFSEEAVMETLSKLKHASLEELYESIGSGAILGTDVLAILYPGSVQPSEKPKPPKRRWLSFIGPGADANEDLKDAIPLEGLKPGMAIHFAPCCHPLPGDRIVGIAKAGEGVIVHTIDCLSLQQDGREWLDIRWDPKADVTVVGQITMSSSNEPGALGAIATIIADHNGNITNLRFLDQDEYYAELTVDIAVDDAKHLNTIITALRASTVVNTVERSRWREDQIKSARSGKL